MSLFITCQTSSLSYLLNQVESNWMVVCGWLHVAYVGNCMVSYESHCLNHVFTDFPIIMSVRVITILHNTYVIMRADFHMFTFIFYTFNRMAMLH